MKDRLIDSVTNLIPTSHYFAHVTSRRTRIHIEPTPLGTNTEHVLLIALRLVLVLETTLSSALMSDGSAPRRYSFPDVQFRIGKRLGARLPADDKNLSREEANGRGSTERVIEPADVKPSALGRRSPPCKYCFHDQAVIGGAGNGTLHSYLVARAKSAHFSIEPTGSRSP